MDAWLTVSILWSSRLKKSKVLESADERMNSLNDLFHSAGAARMGAVLAPLLALAILSRFPRSNETMDIARFGSAATIAVGVFVVFHLTTKRAAEIAEWFISDVVIASFDDKQDAKNGP